jgi:predicted DNA-binding transcriptional regulator YafY
MDFNEKIELIKQFDHYIQNQCTGKPAILAKKLGVSERNIFRLIETLEFMGGELEYCSKIESYRYKKPGYLQLGFEEHNPENPPPQLN